MVCRSRLRLELFLFTTFEIIDSIFYQLDGDRDFFEFERFLREQTAFAHILSSPGLVRIKY